MARNTTIIKSSNLTASEYRLLHFWVEKQLGKPSYCINCKKTGPARTYQWANISGKYLKDVADWKRLCVPCHLEFDGHKAATCKRGHAMSGENVGFKLIHGYHSRYCRQCNMLHSRAFRERKKDGS